MAAVSGLADVGAITLSLANMSQSEIRPRLASQAIILAVMVNTGIKAILVFWMGGVAMLKRLWPVFGLMIASGLLGILIIQSGPD